MATLDLLDANDNLSDLQKAENIVLGKLLK